MPNENEKKVQRRIGIDIGSQSIKLVEVSKNTTDKKPIILHTLSVPSEGFQYGYVVEEEKASQSLKKLLKLYEKTSKRKLEEAIFSIGGLDLQSHVFKVSLKKDKEKEFITEQDIEKLFQKAEYHFFEKYPDKKILHLIPLSYFLDEREVVGKPIGAYTNRISLKILFIDIPEYRYENFQKIIQESKIEIDDIIASPIAEMEIALNYQQKREGCGIVNIGAETMTISSFKNGKIQSLEVTPLGSKLITNKIALSFQIPLEEAESLKKGEKTDFSKKKIEEIFVQFIQETENSIKKHIYLQNNGKPFPAGVIFTGGGSQIPFLDLYAKRLLKIPIEIIKIKNKNGRTKRHQELSPEYSTAYGLTIFSYHSSQEETKKFSFFTILKRKMFHLFQKIKRELTP